MSFQTINPSMNKTVKSFEEMTEKPVEAKVVKATKAFAGWKETSYEHRADLLHKVATFMKIKSPRVRPNGLVFFAIPNNSFLYS